MREPKGRKVVTEEWIVANGIVTVRAEVVVVPVPEPMVEELMKGMID